MPNWCDNYLSVSHSDPLMIQKFVEAAKEEKIAGTFIPVPKSVYRDTDPTLLSKAEYDWRVRHWGTKWDFGGDFDGDKQGVSGFFQSAWAPPIGIFEELEKQGFQVHALWHEPGMCFAGVYKSGEVTDYNNVEYTTEGLSKLPRAIVNAFNLDEMIEYQDEE